MSDMTDIERIGRLAIEAEMLLRVYASYNQRNPLDTVEQEKARWKRWNAMQNNMGRAGLALRDALRALPTSPPSAEIPS